MYIHHQLTEGYVDKRINTSSKSSIGKLASPKEVHDEELIGRFSVWETVIEMIQSNVLQRRRITVSEFVAHIPESSCVIVD